jgi:uncharacterized membrane protein HdeD (DUF308 family)
MTERQTTEDLDAELKKVEEAARAHWGWLLALGILFLILGTVGLGMTVALTITSILFLGAFLLVGGIFQLVAAFTSRKEKSSGKETALEVLQALLYVVAGIWVLYNPAMATVVATAVFAGFLVALGVVRTIAAFERKPEKGWGWLLVSGIASLALAAMIFLHWPASALWIIGLMIAVEMIFHGWAYIFVALALRRS